MGESAERPAARASDAVVDAEPCEASVCTHVTVGINGCAETVRLPSPASPSSERGETVVADQDVSAPSQDNDSSSSSEDRAPRKRAPMRNLSRDRRRAELVALRGEADALERQRNLLMLKRKHELERAAPEHGTSRWQCAAENERRTRERAESENERLTAMLRQQIGLSSALESLLRKRLKTSGESQDDDSPQPSRSPHHSPRRTRSHDVSLGMLHAQFSRDIQRLYKAGIDRIFTGNDWTAASAELGRAVVREDKFDEATHSPMVELRETRHVPFEYQRVADAMWRCALHPFAEHGRLLESYESAEDRIAFKYRAATPGNKDRGDLLTAVMVIQKFEEPDRTIHVWRIMSSSTEESTVEARRAYSDETGWFVVEPVPPGVPGIEAGTAIVRIVSQLIPLWTHDLEPIGGPLSADDFHDLVVKASCEDMVALGDAVGNLLLDESLGLTSDVELL